MFSIQLQNLSKEYKLGVIGRGTLYRDLQSWWAKVNNKPDPNSNIYNNKIYKNLNNKDLDSNTIVSINSINLNIKRGEVLGIIGNNGSGKSTLLKLISRITSPTAGLIKIKGKTASLLEVGTGFHSELTGKENIYLNAAINGLSKKEIDLRFDDIIEFAGIKKFKDTPVKRYSSGMFVRLGFAVAAYLNPDNLIVDEVLAVGDAEFQNKAIGKMQDIKNQSNKTILFVSHNMDSILKLCTRVIVLNNGSIVFDGNAIDAVNNYLKKIKHTDNIYGEVLWKSPDIRPGSNSVKLISIKTLDKDNNVKKDFKTNEKIKIEVKFELLEDNMNICSKIAISYLEKYLFVSIDDSIKREWYTEKDLKKGIYVSECIIPENLLCTGDMDINLDLFIPPNHPDNSYQIRLIKSLSLKIIESDIAFDTSRGSYPFNYPSDTMLRPKLLWSKTNELQT